MYTIKIKTHNGHGCWLQSFLGDGDPSRTLIKANALKFAKKKTALSKIELLEKEYPNRAFSLDDDV